MTTNDDFATNFPFFFSPTRIQTETNKLYTYIYFFRYYLNLARQICLKNCPKTPSRFQWIFTNQGYKFFLTNKWSFKNTDSTLFSCLGNTIDPLAFVTRVRNTGTKKFVQIFKHYRTGF